jgi:predicted kinase
MRAEGDYRADTIVKKEMLDFIRSQGHNVRLVVDDRPSVVQMWKSQGLTVLEHDSGEWDNIRTWETGELHIVVGPSGAGKSTWLSKQSDPNGFPLKSLVISSDGLRAELCGDFRDQSKNDQVFKALYALVRARVKSGLVAVVDATNLHSKDRRALRDCCDYDTKIYYHVIDRPLSEKHRDAGWRDEVVINGVKLIDKHHQSFQSGLKAILRGDDDPRVTVQDHRRM